MGKRCRTFVPISLLISIEYEGKILKERQASTQKVKV